MFSIEYFLIYCKNYHRNFDISKTLEKLIERPLNKRGKIDIDMEVSSHDAAKEFPNLLKYMYGGGLTLNRSSAPGLLDTRRQA